jgi:hypothetical protein
VTGPRKLLLAVMFVILATGFSAAASAANIYIAQNAAGGNTGADCADAFAVSWFNNSANWGSGAGQIGPGTTVHLCGTFNAPAGASEYMVFSGSGTSGNPITLMCDPTNTVTIAAAYWGGNIIDLNGQSYLTLNGTNCTIQATANGTSLANQHSTACGICSSADVSNSTIEYWTISNIYVHVCSGSGSSESTPCPTTNDSSGGSTEGIQIWGGTNDKIAYNTVSNVHWGIVFYYGGSASNSTNIQIYNNTISGMDHGVVFGDQGSNSTITSSNCSSAVHDNDFSNMQPWDDNGDNFHHDGIHAWANNAPGSYYQGVCFYNNYFHGNMGWHPSGLLSSESLGNANYYFNNVIGNLTGNTYCADGLITHFTGSGSNGTNQVFVNNTIDPGSTPCSMGTSSSDNSGANFGNTQASGTIFESNLLLSNAQTYVHSDPNSISTSDYNVYGMQPGANPFYGTCGSGISFSTWQGSCGFDAHGKNISVTVNSDYTLPSASSAIGIGTTPENMPTAYFTGAPQTFGVSGACGTGCVPRSSSGAQDAGAYPHGAGIAGPNPPSGLTAVVQ